jgi:hypothetical protein
MARVTQRAINKALADNGFPGVEIVAGNGYFYFSGGDTPLWRSTSVMTFHLSSLTVEEWVDEARSLRAL